MSPLPQGMSAPRWLVARMMSAGQPVRFIYQAPGKPAGLRVVHLYDRGDHDIGRLVWQVCRACSRGSINKISIVDSWQRRGLGRRLIARALRDGPGCAWVTSGQSPDAKKFFASISAETGIAFTERGSGCTHMKTDRRYVPPNRRQRPPRPRLNRCGCQIFGQLMRPARTHGSAHRVDLAA
jgi:GNAT superfamily N-acetyltransferase